MTTAARLAESNLEEHTLAWLRDLGYSTLFGPDIGPGEAAAERSEWHEVVLKHRLNAAITRLNPDIPKDARDAALRKVLHPNSPSLVSNNHAFHRMLVDGFVFANPKLTPLASSILTPPLINSMYLWDHKVDLPV